MKGIWIALAVLITTLSINTVWADPGAAASSGSSSSSTNNIRFDPVTLLLGVLNVNWDIKVGSNWTVGPQLGYINLSDSESDFSSNIDVSAYALGARFNWFANGVFNDGLYVGPSLSFVSATAKGTDLDGNSDSATASGIVAECLVGYGWFWQSFNMMLGGGLTVSGAQKVSVTDSSGNSSSVSTGTSGLALEWSLGWTF